ncbi:MAG: 16S rRNA (cytidine(1402)-2'-O)-methyltransferase [Bacteroidales bacterium]
MSKLYLVPTPIGNLKDITLRALETLKSVDLILAEDTRVTMKLLAHYSIQVPVRPYHQHNEHKVVKAYIEQLQQGTQIAVVTDAGTPGISDPGFLIVRECIRQGIPVETLPGPVALIPALVNSGLPSERFRFEGFLPVKKGRKTRLEALAGSDCTMIFYESPHRIVRTLTDLGEVLGMDREASVSREITKIHEETLRGSLMELINHFSGQKPKGEFVIVVSAKNPG